MQAAIIAGIDGLLIDGITTGEHDLEALAAVGTYALRASARISELEEISPPTRLTVEFGRHVALVQSFDDESTLMVLLRNRFNLGYAQFVIEYVNPA